MSLRVWLPLTGDFRNQGLLHSFPAVNSHITGNRFTDTGKIGGSSLSYTTTLSTYNTWFTDTTNNNFISLFGLGKKYSIAGWFKIKSSANTTNNSAMLVQLGYNNDTIYPDKTYRNFGLWWTNATSSIGPRFVINNGDYGSAGTVTGPVATDYDVWHHIAYSFDNTSLTTKCVIYVDGIAVTTKTFTKTNANCNDMNTTNANNILILAPHKFCYNDLRIYDHLLSAKEVAEIAKGLVLHYKLDNNGCGNENLYTGSYDFSGTWVNKANWTDDTNTYNGFLVKKRSGAWGGLAQNITCSLNDIFTISFWAKVDSGGNIQSIHRSNLGNVTTGLTILGGSFSSSTIWIQNAEDGTQWKRYWATVQIISSDITYLQWRIENSVADKNLYICGFKLEKGTAATSWCPAKTDTLYSLYAANDTTVYDSSGYGNNGTITGSLTTATPNPRYSVATSFNGSTSRIEAEPLPTETKTISAWLKWNTIPASSPYSIPIHDKQSGLAIGAYQNGAALISYVGSGAGGTGSCVSTSLATNTWYHIVVIKTGDTTRDVYVNSVKATPTSNNWWGGDLNKLELGCRHVSSAYSGYFNGQIVDFRAYVTALTPAQIKELYNTSMSIDNNGNIHARELVEL